MEKKLSMKGTFKIRQLALRKEIEKEQQTAIKKEQETTAGKGNKKQI